MLHPLACLPLVYVPLIQIYYIRDVRTWPKPRLGLVWNDPRRFQECALIHSRIDAGSMLDRYLRYYSKPVQADRRGNVSELVDAAQTDPGLVFKA